MRLKSQKLNKGFTLLELLIVISIMGLLAGMIMVSFPGVQKRARLAQALQFSDSLRGSLQMDMIGWWPLDETSGTVAKDSWFDQNHGTLNGNPQWVDGVINGALEFDGDDYVDCGVPDFSTITGAVTIEFWVYPTNYALRRQNPICKAYGGEFCMTMERDSSVSLYYGTAGGNSSPYTTSRWPVGTLEDNEWIHIAWAKNPSTGKAVAYKNGNAVQTMNCGSYCETTASSAHFYIANGYAGRFVGLIDEVRIYSVSLPEVRIQQHYAQGLPSHPHSLVRK